MTEAGIKVQDLATACRLGTATLGRARRGNVLPRVTQVRIFDAILQNNRCQFLRPFRNRLLVTEKPAEDIARELETAIRAGFAN